MQLDQIQASDNTEILLASGAIAASSQSAAKEGYRNADGLIVYFLVTAVAGTLPTLDVKLQDSPDGTNWFDVATLTQITGTGNFVLRVTKTTPFANKIRLSYTLGGSASPSVTLSATAYAAAKVVAP